MLVLNLFKRILTYSDSGTDLDLLESQWRSLGSLTLPDIFSHPNHNSDLSEIHISHFWSCVLSLKNAGGIYPFKELSLFALKCLTLPISNAIVERIFSFMAAIKTKQRNKMQIQMLDALLRLRIHLKVRFKVTFIISIHDLF